MSRIVAAGLGALLAACASPSGPGPGAPGGHHLVFEGVLGTVPELLVLDTATTSISRLLPAGTVAMDPTPSPDGSRIAFVVADYGQSIGDIWIVNRDGSGLRQLTTAPELDDQPSWSPDGTQLVFRSFRTGRSGDIWRINADGAGAVNLTPDPLPGVTDERHPAWSPDGSRIAFTSDAGGNYDIWTMTAFGASRVRLTNTEAFDAEPAWSPDGTTLVFRRSEPVIGSDLWLIPAAGGSAGAIPLPGEQRQPLWSTDGARIVFVSQPGVTARPDIYSMRPDGTEIVNLVGPAVTGGSLNPAWLPRR